MEEKIDIEGKKRRIVWAKILKRRKVEYMRQILVGW